MPADDTLAARSAVAARLRAAGCVYAEDEADLLISAARSEAELTALVDRRAAGQPIEHVVGWAEFCGLRIAVDPGVFVPRRRSEFLVRQAARLPRLGPVPVVDLCCGTGRWGSRWPPVAGSGCTPPMPIRPRCAAPGAMWPRWVAGVPGRPLQPAARHAARLGCHPAGQRALRAHGEVGLLPPEARDHEARQALDGGPDGLDVLRRVRPRRLSGWRPVATCCSRPATARWPRRPRPLPPPG